MIEQAVFDLQRSIILGLPLCTTPGTKGSLGRRGTASRERGTIIRRQRWHRLIREGSDKRGRIECSVTANAAIFQSQLVRRTQEQAPRLGAAGGHRPLRWLSGFFPFMILTEPAIDLTNPWTLSLTSRSRWRLDRNRFCSGFRSAFSAAGRQIMAWDSGFLVCDLLSLAPSATTRSCRDN